MKQFYKKIFYLFMVLTALSACQDFKDGLTGKKKNNSDEFLIEKKNPLVLPPKFDELPKPKTLTEENKNKDKYKNEKEIDLKSAIITESVVRTEIPIDKTIDSSLKNIILEKIKEN
jgi:hypothetical protein